MSQKILVLGANGTVGKHLVAELLACGEQVKAASRNATPMEGAEAVAFDFTTAAGAIEPLLDGVDRLFLMLPTGYVNSYELLAPVAQAAIDRGIKVVFQSVLGVDADDSIPYRKVELMLINSGVASVVLRPNWFMDNFVNFWLPGIQHDVIAVPAAEGQSSFIDSRDIAASAAAALTSSAFDNQQFNLTGPQAMGYADAAELIGKAIGRPLAYQPLSDDDFIAMLTQAGVPADYAGFLASIFAPVRMGWTAAVSDAVEQLTGSAPRTLEAWIAEHQAVLASQG